MSNATLAQDYLTESERLHKERNPNAVTYIATLVYKPFGEEQLIRFTADDDSFQAFLRALAKERRAQGLELFELFDSSPVTNEF